MSDIDRQEKKPTHAGIMEEMFAKDVRKLMKAWRDAGKPHKR